MTFKLIDRFTILSLLFGLMVFNSCKKEDSVQIIEIQENLELGLQMTINGKEINMDVFASYCQGESKEFLIISNKIENLDLLSENENLEENDFTFFANITDEATIGYGSQVLGENITELAGLSVLFTDDKLTIEANNDELVVGSSEGVLKGIDPNGEEIEYPYVMKFVAEIVEISEYCEDLPVENPNLGYKININDTEIETDVFASFCQSDSVSIVMISNKIEHLVWPFETFDFEENDFVFFIHDSEELYWSYGGITLGEEVTGFPGLLNSFSDAEIVIQSNDGETISGFSQGILLGTDGYNQFSIYPYAIEFVAEIVQENEYCE